MLQTATVARYIRVSAFFQTLWAMNCERKNVWKTWTWIAGGFQALGILQLHNNGVCKDANRWLGLPFRVFQTQFLCLVNYSTGLKTRGYSPIGLRVFQTPLSLWAISDELWVFLTKEHKFRRSSKLTTHCSLLKNVWKTWIWIAGGFQALGFLRTHNKGRLQRRGTATLILKNHRTRTILSSPHPDHTSQKT